MSDSLCNNFFFSFFFLLNIQSPSIQRILSSRLPLCDLRAKAGMKITIQNFLHCGCYLIILSDTLIIHLLSLPINSDTNLFLNLHPDAAVQDAPLALITKPRSQICQTKPHSAATSPQFPMPINLSTGTKEMSRSSASTLQFSAPSGVASLSRKAARVVNAGTSLPKTNSSCASVDLTKRSESDFHSGKDSDDSLENYDDDDDEDDFEDEDSGSSFSG